MVSCAQSLHGLFDTLEFFGVVEEDFLGATVGTVVAERLDDIWFELRGLGLVENGTDF